MGYIFDAMSRSGQPQDGQPPPEKPDASTPSSPSSDEAVSQADTSRDDVRRAMMDHVSQDDPTSVPVVEDEDAVQQDPEQISSPGSTPAAAEPGHVDAGNVDAGNVDVVDDRVNADANDHSNEPVAANVQSTASSSDQRNSSDQRDSGDQRDSNDQHGSSSDDAKGHANSDTQASAAAAQSQTSVAQPAVVHAPAPTTGSRGVDISRAMELAEQQQSEAASEQSDQPSNESIVGLDETGQLDRKWLREVDSRLVSLTDPTSLIAEEYRSIRTGILARWKQGRNLVHTITSATPQEGKTITSLNLSLTFSELRNRRTILLEADLRLPQFSNLLSIQPQKGMVELIEGTATLDEVVLQVGEGRLNIVPVAQRGNDHAVQLLSSPAFADLLKRLRQQYDHVLIDTPPVLDLADAGIVGAMSDDLILLARIKRTPRPLVAQAVRTLASYGINVAGIIATDQARSHGRYSSRYRYRYGYQRYASYRTKSRRNERSWDDDRARAA